MHLRSSLRRALLLASNKNANTICPAVSVAGQQIAALGTVAPSHKLKPAVEPRKYENNIVVSPYADCAFHDSTLTQRFFESAARWPDKIALVSFFFFNLT